jgi:plant 3beta-hydroxysteroid-4alpha-carboxylate 3-dehydrogenase
MKANGTNGLLTCCLRPSSIFGPGDRLLVPSLVSAARAGKLKVISAVFLNFRSVDVSLEGIPLWAGYLL